MRKRNNWTFLCLLILLGSCAKNTDHNTSANEQPASEIFHTEAGAIGGYDPVSYFREGRAVKGDEKYSEEWKDVMWHFSNLENLQAFKADPEKFAPQYGGYCAFGTAQGHKAPTQPDAWRIIDGKLYFNYNKEVQVKWLENQEQFIKTADKNWPDVKRQPD